MPKKTPIVPAKVQNYLEKNAYRFEALPHRTVFTAYDLAQTLKFPLEKIAKVLLVRADKDFALIVVAAKRRLDMAKIKKALKVKSVKIASEKDMVKYFKVKAGAMTAFAKLHGIIMALDRGLAKESQVLFPSGDFQIALRLSPKQVVKNEEAILADLSVATNLKLQTSKKPKKKSRPKKKARPSKKKAASPKRKKGKR